MSITDAEFAKSCVGTSVAPYMDPYGNPLQGTVERANLPECVALKAEMAGKKSELERKGAEVQDAARRAGVLPGVFRRLAEKYGLQLYRRPRPRGSARAVVAAGDARFERSKRE